MVAGHKRWVVMAIVSIAGVTACTSPSTKPSPEEALGATDLPPRRDVESSAEPTDEPTDELLGAESGDEAAPSCSDGIRNGDETDVDCGGACGATCADGRACEAVADCSTNVCAGNKCCSRSAPATKSSGPVSGTMRICCEGAAIITSVKDCGVGANHTAVKVTSQCAEAREGTANGGSSCVEITCGVSTCSE